jgi:transcriptional regulator with XRE-family HTH domain
MSKYELTDEVIKYGWTDKAVQAEIGERFKQLRLRRNITLEVLHERTLISVNTLKALERGKGKLETMVVVLREFGVLEELNNFIAPAGISPVELMKLRGKTRIRASKTKKAVIQVSRHPKWAAVLYDKKLH